MREEQRAGLLALLKEVHNRVHHLYPRGQDAAEPGGHALRNQLLVIDLVVHLAEEVISAATPEEQKVAERAANLLYALHLVAPHHQLGRAAELLIAAGPESD